jgi:copper homeostasis protein
MELLELAVFRAESVIVAADTGVQRIEACEDYAAGGVTPSLEFFKSARKAFSGDVFVMIRPRAGDFVYAEPEFKDMLQSVHILSEEGADGFVAGFLQESGEINEAQLKRFTDACAGKPFTFHRAFDLVRDWRQSMDVLMQHGCSRVLSSGGQPTAMQGRYRLKEMQEHAGERMIVLPGGSVRASVAPQLLDTFPFRELHSAAVVHPEGAIADADEVRALLQLQGSR